MTTKRKVDSDLADLQRYCDLSGLAALERKLKRMLLHPVVNHSVILRVRGFLISERARLGF